MTTYIMADWTTNMWFVLRTVPYHTAQLSHHTKKSKHHDDVCCTESEIFKNDIFPKGDQNNASSSQNDRGGSQSFTQDETRSKSLA